MAKEINIQKFREYANLSGITDAQMVAIIQTVVPRFTKYDFSKALSGKYGLSLTQDAINILTKKYPDIARRSVVARKPRTVEHRALPHNITLRLTDEELERFQLLCDATGRTRQDTLRYILNREVEGIEEWINEAAAPADCGVRVEPREE